MDANELIDKLHDEGLRVRSYSGRGMYGRECVAAKLDEFNRPGDYDLPKGWSQDSLGKGTIVYWPDVAWPEGRKET